MGLCGPPCQRTAGRIIPNGAQRSQRSGQGLWRPPAEIVFIGAAWTRPPPQRLDACLVGDGNAKEMPVAAWKQLPNHFRPGRRLSARAGCGFFTSNPALSYETITFMVFNHQVGLPNLKLNTQLRQAPNTVDPDHHDLGRSHYTAVRRCALPVMPAAALKDASIAISKASFMLQRIGRGITDRYSAPAQLLHWLTALVITTIPIGWIIAHMGREAPNHHVFIFFTDPRDAGARADHRATCLAWPAQAATATGLDCQMGDRPRTCDARFSLFDFHRHAGERLYRLKRQRTHGLILGCRCRCCRTIRVWRRRRTMFVSPANIWSISLCSRIL